MRLRWRPRCSRRRRKSACSRGRSRKSGSRRRSARSVPSCARICLPSSVARIGFEFRTACRCDGYSCSPPPAKRRGGGGGGGGGGIRRSRVACAPPPPPPPRHAQGRVEGGEMTEHGFAISPHVFAQVLLLIPLAPKRGRRESRALDA